MLLNLFKLVGGLASTLVLYTCNAPVSVPFCFTRWDVLGGSELVYPSEVFPLPTKTNAQLFAANFTKVANPTAIAKLANQVKPAPIVIKYINSVPLILLALVALVSGALLLKAKKQISATTDDENKDTESKNVEAYLERQRTSNKTIVKFHIILFLVSAAHWYRSTASYSPTQSTLPQPTATLEILEPESPHAVLIIASAAFLSLVICSFVMVRRVLWSPQSLSVTDLTFEQPSPPSKSNFDEDELFQGKISRKRWLIRSHLGTGSQGVVYLANDKKTGAMAVIKKMKKVNDKVDQMSIYTEIASLKMLTGHEGVVRLKGTFEDPGYCALFLVRLLYGHHRQHLTSDFSLTILVGLCVTK